MVILKVSCSTCFSDLPECFFKAVPVILLLPAAPFMCASDIKSKQFGLAWSIILYSVLYTGAIVALTIAALS